MAAVGFSFRIEALALPLIGVGMFTRMLRPNTRLGDLGAALAGFGLFFIGIDLMKDAFEAFAQNLAITTLSPTGVLGVVVYVLAGALMTVMTQSSSAAIAITLTAATGGVLGMDAAAATVIGANVGTTSTAAFAVIGATANARRVAAAHVIFNFVTAIVALLLLPLMLWIVRVTGSVLGLDDIPAVSLALFHTVFNVLGVLLMWPLTTRLAQFLLTKFTTQAERLSRPQFLDSNVMATPALAIRALSLELTRVAEITRRLATRALESGGAPDSIWRDEHRGMEALCDQIVDFVARLETAKLPAEVRGDMPVALRVTAYLEEVGGLLGEFEAHRADIEAIAQPSVAAAIDEFKRRVVDHIGRCDPDREGFAGDALTDDYRRLHERWRALKNVLLEAASERTVPVYRLNTALEAIRSSLRAAEQLTKAAARLHDLTHTAMTPKDTPAPREDEGEAPQPST